MHMEEERLSCNDFSMRHPANSPNKVELFYGGGSQGDVHGGERGGDLDGVLCVEAPSATRLQHLDDLGELRCE